MTNHLFLYGTLLPQHTPKEMVAAVAKLRPIGKGTLQGILYDFGEYPGAIADKSSKKKVAGTVFQMPDDPELLRQFDDYEGYNPAAPALSLFTRKLSQISLTRGRKIQCWVYLYNGKPGAAPVMAGGRYPKKRSSR